MFDPVRFATLGQQLSTDGDYADHAAKTRTALGRAYYSLLLAVRTAIRGAEGKPVDTPISGGDHGHLFRVLEDSGVRPLMALGKTLEELYTARSKADYHLDPPEPFWVTKLQDPKFAAQKLDLAKDAIRRIGGFDFTPIKGKV